MRILQVASEAVPFAKSGGLGDVVGALSGYLASRGHEVALYLPLYRETRQAGYESVEELLSLEAGVAGRDPVSIRVQTESIAGVEVRLIDAPRLFDREGLYGTPRGDHPDNAERFSTLVRAALAATAREEVAPDVIHCHDWQAALAPVYLKAGGAADPVAGLGDMPVLLTLHNMAYQGVFPVDALEDVGLPEGLASANALGIYGQVSFLKGGLIYADRVSTVSPTYAREIATPEFGFGLEDLISDMAPPVKGILNGIDTTTWSPATDRLIPACFDRDDLGGKAECKRALQEEFGLTAAPKTPLFGMVSRLVDQKGLGLVTQLGSKLAGRPAQFVFLGTGEKRLESLLRRLARENRNVAIRVAFSERLAHLIEAGADFFLMPSAFEPCGLNQMISQAYGTLPVVHRVGGLADSVVDSTPEAIDAGDATGVVFDEYSAAGLASALDSALDLYRQPEVMLRIIRTAMGQDFSWSASGRRYEQLYREMARRGSRRESAHR